MHPVTQSTLVNVSNIFFVDNSMSLLYCFFSFSLNTPEDEKDLSWLYVLPIIVKFKLESRYFFILSKNVLWKTMSGLATIT